MAATAARVNPSAIATLAARRAMLGLRMAVPPGAGRRPWACCGPEPARPAAAGILDSGPVTTVAPEGGRRQAETFPSGRRARPARRAEQTRLLRGRDGQLRVQQRRHLDTLQDRGVRLVEATHRP